MNNSRKSAEVVAKQICSKKKNDPGPSCLDNRHPIIRDPQSSICQNKIRKTGRHRASVVESIHSKQQQQSGRVNDIKPSKLSRNTKLRLAGRGERFAVSGKQERFSWENPDVKPAINYSNFSSASSVISFLNKRNGSNHRPTKLFIPYPNSAAPKQSSVFRIWDFSSPDFSIFFTNSHDYPNLSLKRDSVPPLNCLPSTKNDATNYLLSSYTATTTSNDANKSHSIPLLLLSSVGVPLKTTTDYAPRKTTLFFHPNCSNSIRRKQQFLYVSHYNKIRFNFWQYGCRWYATDPTADSKVERTLALLEEELLEKEREKSSRLKSVSFPKTPEELAAEEADKKRSVLVRRVWRPVRDFCIHTWNGFKLFGIDVWIASGYCWRLAKGSRLSRREWKQLKTCVADIFRIVPFSVFIIVPLGEFLIPFYMKLFPFMLPSTFKEFNDPDKDRQKMVRKLQQKTAFASFLQNVQEELAMERVKKKGDEEEERESMALEFARFMKKVRAEGAYVSNAELLRFTKLFENELTLDNLAAPQLRALCGIVAIPPAGTPDILRFQLRLKLRTLAADDEKIVLEGGVDSLTISELQQASRDRGMRALGVPEERLKAQLKQWLELSLDEKVPPSLLLLSRTLYLPETSSFTDRLKSVFADLPESIAEETRLKISELETGQVDYKARLELVQRVQTALKEERKLRNQAKKETEEKEAKKAEENAAVFGAYEALGKFGEFDDAANYAHSGHNGNAPSSLKDNRKTTDAASQIVEEIEEARQMHPHHVDSAPHGFQPTEPLIDIAQVQRLEGVKEELGRAVSEATEALQTMDEPVVTGGVVEHTIKKGVDDVVDVMDADLTQLESVLVSRRGVVDDVKEDLTELKEAYEEHMDDVEELNLIVTERFGESAKTSKAAQLLNKRVSRMISSADKMLEKLEHEKILAIPQKTDGDAANKEYVAIADLIESLHRLQTVPNEMQMEKVRHVLNALDDNKDGSVNVENALEVIELMGEDNVKISADSMGKILKMLKTEDEVEGIEKYRGYDPISAYIYGNLRKVTSPEIVYCHHPSANLHTASSSSGQQNSESAAESSNSPDMIIVGKTGHYQTHKIGFGDDNLANRDDAEIPTSDNKIQPTSMSSSSSSSNAKKSQKEL